MTGALNGYADWDIVVVTYNSSAALKSAWGDVPAAVRARVICVDNSSSDGTREVAETLFPRVVSSANRGLSVANNLGASLGESPYILYANPDLTPRATDFALLASHLDQHGGLVAPRLVGEDGLPQENARGWPVLSRQVLNRIRPRRVSAYQWPVDADADSPVPWILGAAIAVRREDVEALGGWPSEYFLYYEDVALSLNAWSDGMPVWVLGSLAWTHAWARESRGIASRTTRMHLRSAARFFLSRPQFLFGVPRRLRERFRHEVSKAPALESGVKVDMVLRSDAGHKGGGDLVQAEKYAEELRALGVDVRLVPFSVGFAPRGGAIVHAFNTDRPCELRHLMRIVAPERMVVSPVHHSSRLSRRMRAAERGGSVRDEVGARLPERVRVFALYAARVVRDLDASVWDRARAVAFAGADLLKPRGSLGRQLQGVRAVLLLSQRERDEMAVDLGYRGANHVTVPNGLESLGAPLLPWAQRERRVVVVGRIEPRKRQVEVLEAANRLGVPLTFVGAPNDGRPQYMARFRDALAAGPSEWVGALPREDVLGLMGRSRVLLNLSWVEVQSLVDLEGAAAGCYVVTSAAGSTKEWLGDLVDEFPVAELDAAVERAHELSQVSHSPAPFDYVHTWASAANRLRAVYRGGAAPSAVVAE